jgi:hypothetical protein
LTRGNVSKLSRGHAYMVHPDGTVDFAGNKIHPTDFKAMAEAVLADVNFIGAIAVTEGPTEPEKEKPEPVSGSGRKKVTGAD